MAKNSNIEWTDHTFNPWIGCHKVSDGCKNCYAEEMMDKRYGNAKWGVQGTRQRTTANYWKQPLSWNRKAEAEGSRHRVFCASLADVMEDREGLGSIRQDLFRLIEATPNLDWLLLTKWPENYLRFLPDAWLSSPQPNVWLGTSIENQATADERIPHLIRTPAVVRFVSAEPLLGEINLGLCGVVPATILPKYTPVYSVIHWVIVGGESGRKARPMHPRWVRSLQEQCTDAGVAFFFKQWGEYQEGVRRVGKSKAGRLLDGRTWDELPGQKNQ